MVHHMQRKSYKSVTAMAKNEHFDSMATRILYAREAQNITNLAKYD